MVNRWYSRYRKEGNCSPRVLPGAKSKVNQEALIKYISANPDATLKELSKEIGVSIWGVYLPAA